MTKKTTQLNVAEMTIFELRSMTIEQFQAQPQDIQVQLFQKAVDTLNSIAQPQDRKAQVINALREGPKTLNDVAEELNTNSRNISSVVTALRKEGWSFLTDDFGRKILQGQYHDDVLIPLSELP